MQIRQLTTLFSISIFIISCSPEVKNRGSLSPMNKDMSPISCQLSANPEQLLREGIWVDFSVQSNNTTSLMLLPWQTPLEGVWGDLFLIKDSNNLLVEYQGPVMKRPAPSIDDFVTLPAGESLHNRVELSKFYSLSKNQQYKVSVKLKMVNIINPDNSKEFVNCTTEEVAIRIN